MHSTANLPPLAILTNPSICSKILNFERFDKSYYFSRILQQICYNLVKKKFTFRREQTADFGVYAIGKYRVKKVAFAFERKILLSYYK